MENDYLKQDIQKYIEIDDELRTFNVSLKNLKIQKKSIEDKILDYMKDNKIDQINLGKGKLKLVKTKSFASIKKDYILDKLSENLPVSEAESLTDKIINSRKTTEVTKIERK